MTEEPAGMLSWVGEQDGVVASLASYTGPDPAWARGTGTDERGSWQVPVEEDRSADPRTDHADETVDWFAFAQSGTITGYDGDLSY